MIFLKGNISDSIVDREVLNFVNKAINTPEEEFIYSLKPTQMLNNLVLTPLYKNSTYLLSIELKEEDCFDDGEKAFFADIEIDSYIYSLIAEKKYVPEQFIINTDTREFDLVVSPLRTQFLINRKSIFSLLEYCGVKKEISYKAIKHFDEMN